jgi:2'-5' RNA ligase
LNLPVSVATKIQAFRDTISVDENIKWEPIEKLHLTIKFIGDVDSEIINEISDELMFVENYNSINCSFTKFGFFYRDNRPIILWAGLEIDSSLFSLIDQINVRLQKFSIAVEKNKFKPHITLLRIKNDLGLDFVNSFKNFTFTPIDFSTNSISLYKSELHKDGSKYFEIKNYKLKKLEK